MLLLTVHESLRAATIAWRFGAAHVTFNLADIQLISALACCDMNTPDWPPDLELATRHAGCNPTGDVGAYISSGMKPLYMLSSCVFTANKILD